MENSKLIFAAMILILPLFSNAAALPKIDSVISSVNLDLNNDGQKDLAVLVQGEEEDADLYLFLAGTLALVKKGVAFNGPMWGQEASVSVNDKGLLMISSLNQGIGRDHWEQSLTVTPSGQDFLISNISYSYQDTLNPKAGFNCELNLLEGKGTRNGKPVKIQKQTIRLSDWVDDNLPKACQQ